MADKENPNISTENETEVSEQAKKDTAKKKRSVKPFKKFPSYTIEEILQIPILIKENNGGNAWDNNQLALALGIKKAGDIFYYKTAASRDYGFTLGTRNTATSELTDLGRRYAYAQSQDDINSCLETAFNNIDLFKRVYQYYNGSEPTDDTFFKNALYDTFQVDTVFHDEFIRIYRENVNFVFGRESVNNGNNIGGIIEAAAQVAHSPQTEPAVEGDKLFVIMPFSEKTEQYPKGFFKEVLKQLIVPSAKQAGFVAETADKDGGDIIHSTIIKAIYSAKLILADLTEHNPNVLFELGIAIALKKPVIIIKTNSTGQIFDIDNTIRVYSYSQNLWPSTLDKDIPALSRRIKAIAENSISEKCYFDTFLGQ